VIGLQAYQIFTALTLHFKEDSDYECFKYNFKTRANAESFNKNRMKWQYMNLEKKFTIFQIRYYMYLAFEKQDFGYLTPNMMFKMVNSLAKKENNFIETKFSNDVKYLAMRYNGSTELFNNDDLYPNLYTEYENRKIDIKSFLLLSIHIKDVINGNSSRDIIAWPRFVKKAQRITPFMKHFFSKGEVEQVFLTKYINQVV
jgi:hypothetical protein